MASRYVFRSRAITKKSFGGFYDSTNTGPTILLLVLLLKEQPCPFAAFAIISAAAEQKQQNFRADSPLTKCHVIYSQVELRSQLSQGVKKIVVFMELP